MIDNFEFKDKYNFYDLVEVIRCLRSEGGCPWDIEQTHESIKKNLIEETYETIEAINKKSIPMLRLELGDVMMQVIFPLLLLMIFMICLTRITSSTRCSAIKNLFASVEYVASM